MEQEGAEHHKQPKGLERKTVVIGLITLFYCTASTSKGVLIPHKL